MTIALLIKVNDGLVLASDSASTITAGPTEQSAVENIYNNANKIFNLHKRLPIGAMTWGLGNIGPSSIATIAKDLRAEFQQPDGEYFLDLRNYDLTTAAHRALEFIYERRYKPIVEEVSVQDRPLPVLGFLVAGYSSHTDGATAHVLNLGLPQAPMLQEVLPNSTGAAWWGQPEAIARILNGFSLAAPQALANLGLGPDLQEAHRIFNTLLPAVAPQIVNPAMPIQDAIDLAEFLVHATIQYVRFSPGHPTVGGPIEIAVVTKHEGFKWVRRKHFYDTRLNPGNAGET